MTTSVAKSPTAAASWMAAAGMTLGDETTEVFIQQGERLTESFNDGPAQFSGTGVALIPAGTSLTAQVKAEATPGGMLTADTTTGGWLQDTRDWYAVHRGSCNVLMADGSVKTFVDQDKDFFLNPGFPIPSNLTPEQYDAIGYRSDVVEMHPSRCFNGVFLVGSRKPVPLETSF